MRTVYSTCHRDDHRPRDDNSRNLQLSGFSGSGVVRHARFLERKESSHANNISFWKPLHHNRVPAGPRYDELRVPVVDESGKIMNGAVENKTGSCDYGLSSRYLAMNQGHPTLVDIRHWHMHSLRCFSVGTVYFTDVVIQTFSSQFRPSQT